MSEPFTATIKGRMLAAHLKADREKHEPPSPDLLYHYTGASAVWSIVTEGKLWATHARYLNDASEVAYGLRLVSEELERATERHPNKAAEINQISRAVSTLFSSVGFFVTCFCERDDLLRACC